MIDLPVSDLLILNFM